MSVNCTEMMGRSRGFTLVELVTIMILVGILAVVAIPRMDTSAYHTAQFHDQTVAALRFAQKTAVSHRRLVCVSFPNVSTVQLNIEASLKTGACSAAALALPIPGSANTPNNQVRSSDPAHAKFTALPATLNFDSQGMSGGALLDIKDAERITVVGATGYVQ